MNWKLSFYPEAADDFARLDGSQKKQVQKSLLKIQSNPLPDYQGGYGKPLTGNLSGFLKVKLKKLGIRFVYELVQREDTIEIVIIGLRADSIVYEEAARRILKHTDHK